jgi:hypothetical protein
MDSLNSFRYKIMVFWDVTHCPSVDRNILPPASVLKMKAVPSEHWYQSTKLQSHFLEYHNL